MQDQILGRIWNAHHEQFSASLGSALSAASAKVRGLAGDVPSPLKAMAAVLAMSATTLIFSTPAMAQAEIQVRPASIEVSATDLDIAVESVRPQLEQALARRTDDRFAAARAITITAR